MERHGRIAGSLLSPDPPLTNTNSPKAHDFFALGLKWTAVSTLAVTQNCCTEGIASFTQQQDGMCLSCDTVLSFKMACHRCLSCDTDLRLQRNLQQGRPPSKDPLLHRLLAPDATSPALYNASGQASDPGMYRQTDGLLGIVLNIDQAIGSVMITLLACILVDHDSYLLCSYSLISQNLSHVSTVSSNRKCTLTGVNG